MKGEVKFFHDRDEYGFIETDEMDDDVFFHRTDLGDDLDVESVEEGLKVEFETEEGDKGPKAVNVREV